jgi:hypothetical protein
MKSEEYFKEVYKKSSKQQQVSLDNIKFACDSLVERKIFIRVKLVGKECFRRFRRTSWNTIKGSLILKEYINLRAKEQNICHDDQISDVNRDLLEHYEYLKLENKNLREFIKNKIITNN